MRAREAILNARGQIVFILALAVSLGAIVCLESISTEQHILERLAAGGPSAVSITGISRERAADVLLRAEEAHRASPDSAELQAGLLVALALAQEAGFCENNLCLQKARSLLAARTDWWSDPALAPAMLLATSIFTELQDSGPDMPGGS